MLQVHTFILWAPAREETFESVVNRGYAVITALRDFGPELSPNYLPARRKEQAAQFDGRYETFEALVRKGVNKERGRVFEDLGHSVSFFSSLDDGKSGGISLTLGNRNPLFCNTLVVDLPSEMGLQEVSGASSRLLDLFKKCVFIFEPFWGCIANNATARRHDGYWHDGYWHDSLPKSIHWVNYLGEDLVRRLGSHRIQNAPVHSIEQLAKGLVVVLQESPIDDSSAEDLYRQSTANKHLGL